MHKNKLMSAVERAQFSSSFRCSGVASTTEAFQVLMVRDRHETRKRGLLIPISIYLADVLLFDEEKRR